MAQVTEVKPDLNSFHILCMNLNWLMQLIRFLCKYNILIIRKNHCMFKLILNQLKKLRYRYISLVCINYNYY